MKVMLVNASPHLTGCTYTALMEVADALHGEGVKTELIQVAAQPLHSCTACYSCTRREPRRCIYDDAVNQAIALLDSCDGIVIGSPVHYASASGLAATFCDRLFIAASPQLAFKPGAAVASARRGGTTATLDQLNKYFTINNMPVVSSQYWNMVHGNTPDEVKQDLEGMQIMRQLGRNMAWLIKALAQVEKPARETKVSTNFIR